jgi:hypothetical protein
MRSKPTSPYDRCVLIDPREFAFGSLAHELVDEFYGTATPMANIKPGVDQLSCYDFNNFALVGRSVITAASEVTDPKAIERIMDVRPGGGRILLIRDDF